MDKTCLISIVIPVFNEAGNLDELIRRCLSVGRGLPNPFELILVDDGSRDRSAEIINRVALENAELTGILLNRNYGQHAAVLAGFENARGEIVVTLDADLQNPPEEIPRLIDSIAAGHDVVGSIRANRRDPLFRRAASFVVNKYVHRVTGVRMSDYGCMLRAYRRHIIEAVLSCRERSTFIPILANSFARSSTEITVGHDERRNGHSKYSFYKLISLQFDLLTCMTTFPLRIFSILGGLACLGGVGLGLLLLIMRLVFGAAWAAEGVFTLFAILFIFVGSQFLAFGLIGEYIGRIYNDVRARPRYYIQNIIGANKPEGKNHENNPRPSSP